MTTNDSAFGRYSVLIEPLECEWNLPDPESWEETTFRTVVKAIVWDEHSGDEIAAYFDDWSTAAAWGAVARPESAPNLSPFADRWDRQTAICVGGRWCLRQEWAEEHYDEDGFPFLVWQTVYAWRSDWESIAALARGEEEVGDD